MEDDRILWDFRVLTDAAPLKLLFGAALNIQGRIFPRSHGRGSVEATPTMHYPASTIADFRVLTDAAPLKQPLFR